MQLPAERQVSCHPPHYVVQLPDSNNADACSRRGGVYGNYMRKSTQVQAQSAVTSLHDLRQEGREEHICTSLEEACIGVCIHQSHIPRCQRRPFRNNHSQQHIGTAMVRVVPMNGRGFHGSPGALMSFRLQQALTRTGP